MIGAMVSHSSTARDLDERIKAHNHVLQMLDEIAVVVGMDDTVAQLMEQQRYLDAVRSTEA